MSPVPHSSRRPIILSNASHSTVTPGSLPGALYREDSGEDTITYGCHLYRTDDEDENDGNKTETGVETETDADDYQDARTSIGVATPASFNDPDEYINTRNTLNLVTPLSQVASASQDNFHSIITVTDNDYSSDSDDSLKANHTTNRRGVSVSPPDVVPTPIEPLIEKSWPPMMVLPPPPKLPPGHPLSLPLAQSDSELKYAEGGLQSQETCKSEGEL